MEQWLSFIAPYRHVSNRYRVRLFSSLDRERSGLPARLSIHVIKDRVTLYPEDLVECIGPTRFRASCRCYIAKSISWSAARQTGVGGERRGPIAAPGTKEFDGLNRWLMR